MQYTNVSDNKVEINLGKKVRNVRVYFTNGPYGSGALYCNYDALFDHGDVDKLPLQGKTVTIEAYQLLEDGAHGKGTLMQDSPDGSEIYAKLPSGHSIIIEYTARHWLLEHRHRVALDWDNTICDPLFGFSPLVVVPQELLSCMDT